MDPAMKSKRYHKTEWKYNPEIIWPKPKEPLNLLLKIHKSGNPERYIISSQDIATSVVSGQINSVLKPYTVNVPISVRDKSNFPRKPHSYHSFSDYTILAFLGAKMLYTNVPHKDRLQAFKNTFLNEITANLATKFCDFVLSQNYFNFGITMGTHRAQQLVC